MERMLERGINVCLATDSRASSPDLNLVAEARHVADARPHLAPGLLWSMITTRPAAALGLGDRLGQLAPGFEATFATFEVGGDAEPLRAALEATRATRVVMRGKPVELSGMPRPATPRPR
jgi:cytosine/adenosine deaminase-related metal-dependent hydrolase